MRQPHSLILVTIDCFRADHAGFLGYPGRTTPFLDSLSGESFVFQNAIASGIPTYYSLPALLASRYPLGLGRDLIGIAPGESTITSELKEHGLKTAAFVAANPYISPEFGYDQGFDLFCDFFHVAGPQFVFEKESRLPPSLRNNVNQLIARVCHGLPVLGAAYDEVYFQYCQRGSRSADESLDSLRQFPSADVIVDHAIAWLNQNSKVPVFLWLHLMDPHAPYYPKPQALELAGHGCLSASEAKYLNHYWARADIDGDRLQKKKRKIIELYDAGIRWADLQIERLVRQLGTLNRWDECILAVTADHGEEFLDHGGRFHAPIKLNSELTHVPLLVRVPGLQGSHDVPSSFGLIDLAPTLLDALALPAPANFRGRSCWRKLLNNQSWDKPVFTECVYGCSNPFDSNKRSGSKLLAVSKGGYKLVLNLASGIDYLYDLNGDPNEVAPVPELKSRIHRELLESAKKHMAEEQRSRDFDLRLAAQLSGLRREWVSPATSKPN